MNDPAFTVPGHSAADKTSGRYPAEPLRAPISIAIGIASAGRPDILERTISYLRLRLDPVGRIFVCVPDLSDAGGLGGDEKLEILLSRRGLTTQRNCLLGVAASKGADILVFLDDDFIPAPDFLSHIGRAFAAHPDLVVATGHVLADGIMTGGLTMSDAAGQIRLAHKPDHRVTDIYNAYGCNMAVRLAPIVFHGLSFDEQLPLYGWLEDVDFSRTASRLGRSAKVWGARGVHLGVTSGRQPGLKLGYSQIANPIYLMRKGTMARARAIAQMTRNILANGRGLVRRDGSIDRRGRLRGNFRAIGDLLMGRLSPLRILEFDHPVRHDTVLPSPTARER
jgi:hypothetical protein